jgi:hypothetical protein
VLHVLRPSARLVELRFPAFRALALLAARVPLVNSNSTGDNPKLACLEDDRRKVTWKAGLSKAV